MEFCGECKGCSAERQKFERATALRPADKPRVPFEGWAVDLIVNLEPRVDDYKHLLVAVDCFSKWAVDLIINAWLQVYD